MIGLYVFSNLIGVGAGLVAIIVVKIKWSRQAARRFVTTAAGHDSAG